MRPFKWWGTPQIVIPSSFEEALSYEQQQCFIAKKLSEAIDAINDLEARVEALENERN